MMKKIKVTGKGATLETIINKAGKEFVKVGDSGFSFQSFSVEERTGFTKVINTVLIDDPVCKKYLPIDPNSNELCEMLKNGNEVINSSKKSGYSIVGIGGADIRDGNKNIFLRLYGS